MIKLPGVCKKPERGGEAGPRILYISNSSKKRNELQVCLLTLTEILKSMEPYKSQVIEQDGANAPQHTTPPKHSVKLAAGTLLTALKVSGFRVPEGFF